MLPVGIDHEYLAIQVQQGVKAAVPDLLTHLLMLSARDNQVKVARHLVSEKPRSLGQPLSVLASDPPHGKSEAILKRFSATAQDVYFFVDKLKNCQNLVCGLADLGFRLPTLHH